jgi:hypothetical protein
MTADLHAVVTLSMERGQTVGTTFINGVWRHILVNAMFATADTLQLASMHASAASAVAHLLPNPPGLQLLGMQNQDSWAAGQCRT